VQAQCVRGEERLVAGVFGTPELQLTLMGLGVALEVASSGVRPIAVLVIAKESFLQLRHHDGAFLHLDS